MKQKMKKKKKKKSHKLAGSIVKFLFLFVLAGAALVFAAFSPLFNIASIEVKGNTRYNEKDIITMSGLVTGENAFKVIGSSPAELFRLQFGNAEKMIEKKCAYAKSVKVRLSVPSTVVIQMVERQPAALVSYLGTSLLVDREGDVLEAAPKSPDKGLVTLKGLTFDRYELGEPLPLKKPEALSKAFELIDAIRQTDEKEKDKLEAKLGWIDAGDPDGILILLDNRIKVNLGDLDDLNYRLDATRLIFSRNIKKEDKGMLDFTVGENPVYKPD